MTETVEDMMFGHLKRFQSSPERIKRRLELA